MIFIFSLSLTERIIKFLFSLKIEFLYSNLQSSKLYVLIEKSFLLKTSHVKKTSLSSTP